MKVAFHERFAPIPNCSSANSSPRTNERDRSIGSRERTVGIYFTPRINRDDIEMISRVLPDECKM